MKSNPERLQPRTENMYFSVMATRCCYKLTVLLTFRESGCWESEGQQEDEWNCGEQHTETNWADDSILKCDYLGRAVAFELTSLYNIHFEEELLFNSHGSKYLSAHEPQWLVLRKNTHVFLPGFWALVQIDRHFCSWGQSVLGSGLQKNLVIREHWVMGNGTPDVWTPCFNLSDASDIRREAALISKQHRWNLDKSDASVLFWSCFQWCSPMCTAPYHHPHTPTLMNWSWD